MRLNFAIIMIAGLVTGCASSYYGTDFNRVGAQRSLEGATQVVSPEQVQVYFGEPPEGISRSGEIVSGQGKLLAEANFDRSADSWGFISFNEWWRRFYCPINMTLQFSTLYIYGLTGLPAPCYYEKAHSSSRRIEERKGTILRLARARAAKIGANTIFIPSFGRSSVVTTSGFSTGSAMGSSHNLGSSSFGSAASFGSYSAESREQAVPVASAKVFFYILPQ